MVDMKAVLPVYLDGGQMLQALNEDYQASFQYSPWLSDIYCQYLLGVQSFWIFEHEFYKNSLRRGNHQPVLYCWKTLRLYGNSGNIFHEVCWFGFPLKVLFAESKY